MVRVVRVPDGYWDSKKPEKKSEAGLRKGWYIDGCWLDFKEPVSREEAEIALQAAGWGKK